MMTNRVYQARVGDGVKRKGLKRSNSYFKTPQEAVSEALALKEKVDTVYKNKIEWDYSTRISCFNGKIKILRGYLDGDKTSEAFFLQIISLEHREGFKVVNPKQPKLETQKDKKLLNEVTENLFSDI